MKKEEHSKIYNLLHKMYTLLPNCLIIGIKKVYFFLWNLKNEASILYRKMGGKSKRYLNLKALKNKYEGERCFIVATGPSLEISDLEMLKGEYTFGMNSICLLGDKTDWRPTFYAISDELVMKKVFDNLFEEDMGTVFLPHLYSKKYNYKKDWIEFFCNNTHDLNSKLRSNISYKMKFSDDCYTEVYDGDTVVYIIFQLAVYMGFKEIYLLGTDCNYSGPKQHFIESGAFVADDDIEISHRRIINNYAILKKILDKKGIKVVNVTRGGMLEVFPREKLEDILQK